MCGVHCAGDLWLGVDVPGASGVHDRVSIDRCWGFGKFHGWGDDFGVGASVCLFWS